MSIVKKTKKPVKPFHVVVYCFAVLWSFMTLYPLFVTFTSSLKTNEQIFGRMFTLPETWEFKNYYDAIFGANIGTGIINSLILSISTTICTVLVAMLASYVLARQNYKFITPVSFMFMLGVMLPIHTTIIPISKISASVGGMNSYFFITLIYTTFMLPQAIFLMTGYIKGLGKELDEAAIMDGCGMLAVLFRIIIPISKPIISTVAVLSFIYGYSELIFSVILVTDATKYPISRSLMYFTSDRTVRMGPVFAAIIITVIPMVIIYLFFHESVQKGMVNGAVKE